MQGSRPDRRVDAGGKDGPAGAPAAAAAAGLPQPRLHGHTRGIRWVAAWLDTPRGEAPGWFQLNGGICTSLLASWISVKRLGSAWEDFKRPAAGYDPCAMCRPPPGTGLGVVVATGRGTYISTMADTLHHQASCGKAPA